MYAISADGIGSGTMFLSRTQPLRFTGFVKKAKKFRTKNAAFVWYDYLLERGIHGLKLLYLEPV